MPFPQRQVLPVLLAKGGAKGEHDSLAGVNITVLTNIIHQLSDLSEHATDIINIITKECDHINQRTEKVVTRVTSLAATIADIPVDVKVRGKLYMNHT